MPTFKPNAWILSANPEIPSGNLAGSGMMRPVVLFRSFFTDQQSSTGNCQSLTAQHKERKRKCRPEGKFRWKAMQDGTYYWHIDILNPSIPNWQSHLQQSWSCLHWSRNWMRSMSSILERGVGPTWVQSGLVQLLLALTERKDEETYDTIRPD